MVFSRFLLTCLKSSAFRPGERNNRATGKEKQGYYFDRKINCLFQIITATIKSGFERYINKKYRKILTKFFFLDKEAKTYKVSYSKSFARMKY